MQDPRRTGPGRPLIPCFPLSPALLRQASSPAASASASQDVPGAGQFSGSVHSVSPPALVAGVPTQSPLLARSALGDLVTLQLVCLLPRLQSSLDRLEPQVVRLATHGVSVPELPSPSLLSPAQGTFRLQGPPFFGDTVNLWSHDCAVQVFQVWQCDPANEARRHLAYGGGTDIPFWEWWGMFSRCLPPSYWINCFRCFGCPEPIPPDADYNLLGSVLYRFFRLSGSMHTPLQDLPGL